MSIHLSAEANHQEFGIPYGPLGELVCCFPLAWGKVAGRWQPVILHPGLSYPPPGQDQDAAVGPFGAFPVAAEIPTRAPEEPPKGAAETPTRAPSGRFQEEPSKGASPRFLSAPVEEQTAETPTRHPEEPSKREWVACGEAAEMLGRSKGYIRHHLAGEGVRTPKGDYFPVEAVQRLRCPAAPPPGYCTAAEAAQRWGISRSRLSALKARGLVHAIPGAGKDGAFCYFYRESDCAPFS